MFFKIPKYGYFGLFLIIFSYIVPATAKLGILKAQIFGSLFAFGLFLFTISLNVKTEKSIFHFARDKKHKEVSTIFIYSFFLGVFYEFVGQFLLKLWFYPSLELIPGFSMFLPIYWGVFGVIVRETLIFLDNFSKSIFVKVLISSALLMILIEGINLFTESWIYDSLFLNPFVLFLGWIALIVTFYYVPHRLKLF